MKFPATYLLLLLCSIIFGAPAWSTEPVLTDSRIKTFVYNENDVFSILTHYGYQSNVEFSKNEQIQTVSVGDRIGWQIIPAGRRLFIRALEENAHTNMTVITSKRAYQFDLRSSGNVPLHPSDELVYVARFFYPDSLLVTPPAPLPSTQAAPQAPAATLAAPVAPVTSAALLQQSQPTTHNYNYSYAGSDAIAPLKIFDDGRATYFKLRSYGATPPAIFALDAQGAMRPLTVQRSADGMAMVQGTAARFALQEGDQTVTIFNENLL